MGSHHDRIASIKARGGRPAGTTYPAAHRRSMKLSARMTPRLAAAAQQVAAQEGRTVASLVRVSVQEYCQVRSGRR